MASFVVRLFVIVCVSASAVWTVQGEVLCCSPEQCVISAAKIDGTVGSGGKGVMIYSNITTAADFTTNRFGEEILETSNGQTTKIKIIADFNKKEIFTIVDDTACYTTPVHGFYGQCVPKNAHLEGSFYVGDNKLTVNAYSFPIYTEGYIEGTYFFAATKDECIPFSGTIVGHLLEFEDPVPLMTSAIYLDYEKGISDPGRWFDVPKICQQSKSFNASTKYLDHAPKLVSMMNVMVPIFRKP